MSFFKNTTDYDTEPTAISGIIAEGCSFEGTVVFEGVLRVDGKLTGKIMCRPNSNSTLIIGKSGHIDVDVLLVDKLFVSGKLHGSGPIIILDKADFHGNSRIEIQKNYALYSSNIVIKDDALFQGHSVMIRHETDKTKDQIKNMIFENKDSIVNIPFQPNPLLKKIH